MTEAEREIMISKIKKYFESPEGEVLKERISKFIRRLSKPTTT